MPGSFQNFYTFWQKKWLFCFNLCLINIILAQLGNKLQNLDNFYCIFPPIVGDGRAMNKYRYWGGKALSVQPPFPYVAYGLIRRSHGFVREGIFYQNSTWWFFFQVPFASFLLCYDWDLLSKNGFSNPKLFQNGFSIQIKMYPCALRFVYIALIMAYRPFYWYVVFPVYVSLMYVGLGRGYFFKIEICWCGFFLISAFSTLFSVDTITSNRQIWGHACSDQLPFWTFSEIDP